MEIVARGVPAGLGEPVFDKLSAMIAHAMLSIGGVKGIEFGDGLGTREDDRLGKPTTRRISTRKTRKDTLQD